MQIKVIVKPLGIVRKYLRETSLELSDGQSVSHLVEILNIPWEIRPVVFVNNRRVSSDHRLSDQDEIKIVSLITGG